MKNIAEQSAGNNKDVLYPSRKSLRLSTYDYSSAGYYFVTICTLHRECLFGEIIKEGMSLNCSGQMIASAWKDLPRRFGRVLLDSFVVMPNHIHGIIILKDNIGVPSNRGLSMVVGAQPVKDAIVVGADLVSARICLSRVIQAFKSTSTNAYIRGVYQQGWNKFDRSLWQRSFYDHVIRNEMDLLRVREYILNNPLQWAFDEENPENKK